jgi:RNA polymerase sigma factor (TIGR02999 family)
MTCNASLTDLIHLAGQGDETALRRIFDAEYQQLRALAHARLSRTQRGAMLDTTSLVHESFLRFANAGQVQLADRRHFIRYAASVMRSVIVDLVRHASAERRGGEAVHITLHTQFGNEHDGGADEILSVHEALDELACFDKRLVQVVEMRYFAGMTEQEIADALGITERTVRRDWEKARLLLAEALLDS